MLVIFLGSIGGFISMGFIGLFVGAVILSLSFKIFRAWLNINGDHGVTNDKIEPSGENSKF
jgi:predicted PurR-regulated permease PerM